MVKIEPFEVELWMDKYEMTPNVLNISETCCASISIDDLAGFCEDKTMEGPIKTSTKLNYGPILGSNALRERLASLYSARVENLVKPEDILITPGAIAANFLVLYTLIGPGDHVICVYPTYQQLYSVPESLGAQVSLWKLKREDNFIPDIPTLRALIKPNTKMIIINNPNNPTGATIPKPTLLEIAAVAKQHSLILLSDEVYRPLFHSISPVSPVLPPSAIALPNPKTIVTSSMSKAYSLAGIRLGWIACRDPEIITRLAAARQYTTISVSRLDDAVASYALSASVMHGLLARNLALARTNLALLEKFVADHSSVCSWVKPNAGTTAFVLFEKGGAPVDDEKLCIELLGDTKVLVVPGKKTFGRGEDFAGYVRIGYVCETAVLQEALARMGRFVEELKKKE